MTRHPSQLKASLAVVLSFALLAGCNAAADGDDASIDVMVTSAGAGARPQATATNPTPPSTTPTPGYVPQQIFDGSLLTDTRARAIAEAGGYKYVSFGPCAPASENCAAIDVRERGGPTGRPLRLHIAARDIGWCNRPTQQVGTITPTQAADAAQRTSGSPTTPSTTPTPSAPGMQTIEPVINRCIANYPIVMRVIYNGTSTFLPRYYSHQMTTTFQENSGGYWVSRYSITAGFTQQPWSGDGEEQIRYYEIRNGIGSIISSKSDNVFLMAGSGGANLTTEQQCIAIAKGMEDLAEEVQSWVDTACFLPPISIEKEGVTMEPFDLCGTQAEMAAKLNDFRMRAVNATCNLKPGCYIHGEGDCFDLVNDLADIGPYFAEWAAAEDLSFISTGPSGSCPNKRMLTLDAGPDCVETVEQECDKIGTQCVCETKSAIVTCDTTPRP